MQLHKYRSYVAVIYKMTYREQKRDKTQSQKRQRHSQRKDKCAASQETKRMSWSSHLNLNVNVLFKFILL